MTRGKDVSMLFMDVIKNMETSSLQLKKLIYLYVMSYAKTHPDQALAGINTFRKVFFILFRMPSINQILSSEPSQ
jgi:AP-1 complex subunit beta-1